MSLLNSGARAMTEGSTPLIPRNTFVDKSLLVTMVTGLRGHNHCGHTLGEQVRNFPLLLCWQQSVCSHKHPNSPLSSMGPLWVWQALDRLYCGPVAARVNWL